MNYKMAYKTLLRGTTRTALVDYFKTSIYCGTEIVIAVFGENHYRVYPWDIISIEER